MLFSAVGFLVAAVVLSVFLRPDPLLTARDLAARAAVDQFGSTVPQPRPQGSVRHGARTILATPAALLGTAAVTGGHIVMVAVMVMTPLHMSHGGAEIEVIGFVISVHILGMFGLAPLAGYLTDAWGARRVILLGVTILVVACALAGTTVSGWSPGLLVGLFLLGLGWSCTMVAGSGLVAGAVPVHQRSGVQGAADLIMGLSAAAGGALAGLVVGSLGYGALCAAAAAVALALGAYTLTRTQSLA